MRLIRTKAAVAGLGLALALVACGDAGDDDSEGVDVEVADDAADEFDDGTRMKELADSGDVIIGVKFDQPGIGFKGATDDMPVGFDPELGKVLAASLRRTASSRAGACPEQDRSSRCRPPAPSTSRCTAGGRSRCHRRRADTRRAARIESSLPRRRACFAATRHASARAARCRSARNGEFARARVTESRPQRRL